MTKTVEQQVAPAIQPAKANYTTAWEPIKGRRHGNVYLPSSSELALDSRADHTLYCGARGCGKTDTQLMRFARHVGAGYGSAWRGIIFDRKFKSLEDLVIKAKKWFPRIFGDRCRFLESKGDYKWVWDTGEELLFRIISKPTDYEDYHGHEYPFIGWNELTKWPNDILYNKMMSTNRTSWTQVKDSPKHKKDVYNGIHLVAKKGDYTLPPIPRQVFSTCNSKGIGHKWVKSRFIDVAPYGHVLRIETPGGIFNPQTQKREPYVRTQVTVFGTWRENPHLDPGYIADLESETDENTRKSWLEGSWDVMSGGAFDDVYNSAVHNIPRFVIPAGWYIDRSFDWGSTHPFSIGWWAEANGEEVLLDDGRRFAPVRGTLIRIYEWYGKHPNPKLSNVGCKMSPTDIAAGVRKIEIMLMSEGWINTQPAPGPADNQIGNEMQSDMMTIKDQMSDEGVEWEKSNKSAGSRKIGFDMMRGRLQASARGEGSGLLVMGEVCPDWIATVPILERDEDDEDDVDTESEDHAYDDTRMRCLASPTAAPHVTVLFAA
jgi:hypothetical protein